MLINMKEILQQVEVNDLVWIGEIHGVRENYLAYKEILPPLMHVGFKNLFWEMPADFSENSQYSEDGKINPHAIDFLRWIKYQIGSGILNKLNFFGQIGDYIDYEDGMARQLIEAMKDISAKSIVLTGNYHMANKEATSALNHVEEKMGLKILKIEIKYSGGTFYNYGLKELKKSDNGDSFKFGTVTRHGDVFHYHVDRAHAVFENPAVA